MECNCWVADQSEEDRFSIRYGAHSLGCPTYRRSLDPVDAEHDGDLRRRMQHPELNKRYS